jgi:flagellar protein FlaH
MVDLFSLELRRDGLHRLLGGGIPKGATVLIAGEYGSGKSILSQRFAYAFLKHGYSVTYISTELTTKGFVDQMESLDYPIKEHLLKKEIMFIPVYPLIGSLETKGDFIKKLTETKELYGTDVIVIDTFSSLVKNDLTEGRSTEILSFFKKIAGMNKVIVLTTDPRELREEVVAPFKSSADVFLNLKTDIFEGAVTHTLYVTRFNNAGGRIGDTIGFRVEPGAGLLVDITVVA